MIRGFEKVKGYEDIELTMPKRSTAYSAGYDIAAAEDIVIPPYADLMNNIINNITINSPIGLNDVAALTKAKGAKPTLVPTGLKAKMPRDEYLQLAIRSSGPLKYWLVLANGVGIVDSDFYDAEGHIHFQVINFSPFPIQIKKGDIIGQGIFHKYLTVDNDESTEDRIGGFGSTTK